MRRHLLRFLPIFLLALTVQILAPVAACLARSAVAADPLMGTVLCQGAAADPGSSGEPQSHGNRDGSCALCAAAQAAAPPGRQSQSVALIRYADQVVWRAYAPDARSAKITSGTQARGPPVLS